MKPLTRSMRLVQRNAVSFEDLVEHGGTRYKLRCADGFGFSVIAHTYAYCRPRPDSPFEHDFVPADYDGPFTHVEIGYPLERPEPWDQWSQWAEDPDSPKDTVYGWVPVEAVRDLIDLHGGEA